MQHILESELERLEEVQVPSPRHELGSTISCHLEGSGCLKSSSSVCSVRRLKERRYPGSPRGQRSERPDGPACSLHHTGPYHIPLCASWPPGLRGWQAPPPHWRRGFVSGPSSKAPIPLRHRPQRPALATGSKSSAPPTGSVPSSGPSPLPLRLRRRSTPLPVRHG